MYADDTNITAYHTNINKVEDVLNKDIDILYRWLQANRLSLNVLKSEYMLIGSKVRINKLTSDPKIVIGGHRLKRVVVTKSMGLMIDENLSWEEHVNYMSKKVAKGLAMLKRIRDLMPISTLGQGRCERRVLVGLTSPLSFFRINVFGKSGWPFGKLRQ